MKVLVLALAVLSTNAYALSNAFKGWEARTPSLYEGFPQCMKSRNKEVPVLERVAAAIQCHEDIYVKGCPETPNPAACMELLPILKEGGYFKQRGLAEMASVIGRY